MKKQILTMFTGLFIGAIITGGASAYAAGILAERSSHRIFVDGQEVQMEAYGIAGHNYVKLRDIGKAVGFNVFWDADSGCVQIETGAPYTGEAPSAEAVPSAAAPSDVDAAKQDIVARTNALRAEHGIAALTADDQLMRAAQVRADEMAATGAYSHTRRQEVLHRYGLQAGWGKYPPDPAALSCAAKNRACGNARIFMVKIRRAHGKHDR
jgi:hypothetical protein